MLDIPFSIVVDSREKTPFSFRNITGTAKQKYAVLNVAWEYDTLLTGDYAIKGHEGTATVERKSAPDLLQSLGMSRGRFKREMERLSAMQYAAVAIECSLTDITTRSTEWSRISPRSVVNTMIAWSIDFKVPFWLCDSKRQAEILTFRFLEKAYARINHAAARDVPTGGSVSRSAG